MNLSHVLIFLDYYELAYPGVIMRIILRRKISFHLVQTYIPSSIFVCLAWLSVFVPPEQVPGNVFLPIILSKKSVYCVIFTQDLK